VYRFTLGAEKPKPDTRSFLFRTPPESLEVPIRFVAGGDMRPTPTTVLMNRQAARLSPHFALIGGDIAYANGIDNAAWYRWIDAWTENTVSPEGWLLPIVAALGNHEMGSRLTPEFARELGVHPNSKFFFSLFPPPNGKGHYCLDFGDYLSLVLLDSGYTVPIPDQGPWLEETLAARKDGRYVFACYHAPCYGTAKPPNLIQRKHWVPLFEKHQVTAVFENDHHTFKRTHPLRKNKVDHERGILYLGDGNWGVPTRLVTNEERWHLAKAEPINHIWVVDLSVDQVRFRAVDPQGRFFDDVSKGR
jgi:hypothetical protein